MLNIRIVLAAHLVICSALAAQQDRTASFSRSSGNSQVRSSIDLYAVATRSTVGGYHHALTMLDNDAEFAIGGNATETGIAVGALAYAVRRPDGSLSSVNYDSVHRGDVWIYSRNRGNGLFSRSFPAGTVTDRDRMFVVGSYLVAATIRISAGANIVLTQTSSARPLERAAYLSGSTRTYMDGTVWAVTGLFGATASIVSTLDMDDTTLGVNLYTTNNATGGRMSYSLQSVRLLLRAMARRFWWQSYTVRTLLNTSAQATSGSSWLR